MSDGPIFRPVRQPQEPEDNASHQPIVEPGSDASEEQEWLAAATPPRDPHTPDDQEAAVGEDATPLALPDVDPDIDPGATEEGTELDPDAAAQTEADDDDDVAKRPWWVWALIGGGAALIAIAVLIWALSSRESPRTPAPTITATAPAPTPTEEPVDKGEGSALFEAIPSITNQFTLREIVDNEAWVADRGAIEAYDVTYAGPVDGESATVRVTVAQWDDADAAQEAAKLVTADLIGPDTTGGEVTVDGQSVGSWWAAPEEADTVEPGGEDADEATAAAEASIVWTNGATVIAATGPVGEIQRFFDGYGL